MGTERQPLRVLLVEDDEEDLFLIRTFLSQISIQQYQLQWVSNYDAARTALALDQYDVCVLDYRLGERSGLDLLKESLASGCRTPIIFLTGQGDYRIDLEAMEAGAADYLPKADLNPDLLERSIRYAIERAMARKLLDESYARREKELVKESEDKYRILFDSMLQGVVYQSGDGSIIDANPAAEKILGLTLAQMQGRTSMDPCWRAIHEDGSEFPGEAHPSMVALRTCREVRDVVIGIYNPQSGSYRWININAVPQFRSGQSSPYQVYTTFEDITERKRAEVVLRQSEERLRLFFEHAPAALAMFDSNMRYLSVSRRWLSDFNLGDRDIIGLSHYEVFPEIPERWKEVHRRVLTGEVLQSESDRFDRADGSVQWSKWKARPWHDTSDRIGGLVIFSEDITDRKRAEDALRSQESILRGIFDAAKESIWLFDTDMAVLAANVSAIKRLGVPIEELIGKPIDRFLPEELALSRRAHLKRTVESAQPMEFEDERSGMLFHHCLYPIVNAEGRVTSVVCYSQDITERNRTEETLRASEEKYRRLLEDASDAIFVADGETGMLLEANRQATVLTGWSASELKGMYQRELHPPEESETFSATFMEHIASPGKTVEALVHHKDGRDIPVEITANTFTLNGRIVLQGIFRDVTERKRAAAEKARLEAQLRHSQKLESIGTLAGGIAHDFNNILSPIIGYTEMIMDEIPESSPSRYDINQVLIAANRAKELVKQILSFSRLWKDEPMGPLNLSLTVKEVMKLLYASLPSSIQIKQDIRKVTALASVTQIHQVIVNLCTNAAHAMGDKGILGVSLVEVSLDACDLVALSMTDLKPGKYARLSVSDTGHGMDGDTISRVFDPYFTTKEVGKGTGLGLAVVHGIVKRHGGEIRVRSELGKGSVFDVFLPLVEIEADCESFTSQELPGGSERILLVDDEPAIAEMGARMLEKLGYRVTAKTSPKEVLDLFRSKPDEFDLIITDYTMPQMTGSDLASKILEIRPEIPIILCTGYSEKATETTAKELGLAGFAMKPLDRRQLAELVRNALDENDR